MVLFKLSLIPFCQGGHCVVALGRREVVRASESDSLPPCKGRDGTGCYINQNWCHIFDTIQSCSSPPMRTLVHMGLIYFA